MQIEGIGEMMTRAMFERFLIALVFAALVFFGMVATGWFKSEVKATPIIEIRNGMIIAQYNPNDDYFKVGPRNPYALAPMDLTIQNIVTIKADGTIVYHQGYTPDIAARTMWEAVGKYFGERNCKK